MINANIKELPRQYFERICCVYFIYAQNEIVYIGQTVNLHLRVASHHRLSIPDMDKVKYIELPEKELFLTEKSLIRYFCPERNGIDNLGILLDLDEVEKEVNTVHEYIDNPEFDASKHLSLLCHSMFVKYGHKLYKKAYDEFIDDYTLSNREKIIGMKRSLR